jgi:hypothetical protein
MNSLTSSGSIRRSRKAPRISRSSAARGDPAAIVAQTLPTRTTTGEVVLAHRRQRTAAATA